MKWGRWISRELDRSANVPVPVPVSRLTSELPSSSSPCCNCCNCFNCCNCRHCKISTSTSPAVPAPAPNSMHLKGRGCPCFSSSSPSRLFLWLLFHVRLSLLRHTCWLLCAARSLGLIRLWACAARKRPSTTAESHTFLERIGKRGVFECV